MMRSYLTTWIYEERSRLVLWLPVLLAVGIGSYFGLRVEPPLYPIIVAVALLAGLTWLLRRHFMLRLLCGAMLAISAGFLLISLRTAAVDAPYLYSTQYFKGVSGRIDNIAIREKDQKLYITDLDIEGIWENTTPARISIALRKPAPELKVEDKIRVKAMLFPPPGPAMPGAYDFGRKFYYERLGGVGYTPYVPERLEQAGVSNFDEWLNDLRLAVAGRIRSVMAPDTGAVARPLW